MANKNRYKFHFGEKNLTLTTDKDNLFMEEVERVAYEKYKINDSIWWHTLSRMAETWEERKF